VFAAALARHGVPQELLTDNGGTRSPTTTGKVERFHKTVRTELLDGLRVESLAQAQQVIDAWVEDYNTRRPHQALAMATPAQRFQLPAARSMPPEPPLVVAEEPASPTAGRSRPSRAGEIARLVHANGVIVVTRQVCSVGRRYAGKQVTVRGEAHRAARLLRRRLPQDAHSDHQRGGDPDRRPPTQQPSACSLVPPSQGLPG
jgi:hypothetical protein